MIETIRLKSGRTSEGLKTNIETTPITIFVGPNNSGKSKMLQEIASYAANGPQANMSIIEDIDFKSTLIDVAENLVLKITLTPYLHEAIGYDNILVGNNTTGRVQINKSHLINSIVNPNLNKPSFTTYFLRHSTILLNGANRMTLINEVVGGDLQQPPSNSLQYLFRDDEKRKEIRRIVYEAFNKYFVIDPTELGKLKIRLADKEPISNMEERGIHAEAVSFHSNAISINVASDGVKAFTGMVLEFIAGDPKIILIDEPEAFLHPSLAFKLGYEISRASAGSDKKFFASTHSAQFIMGCIQSGALINVVRLTYNNYISTSRILNSNELLQLMRKPILRSVGVISALFYDYVIVTEADSDRAFYQEINERLLKHKPEYAIPNCLFINAQNKQTVHSICKPLRELGIPVACIVDVDIIKEGGQTWANFLNGGFVPQLGQLSLNAIRPKIKEVMELTGLNMKRDGGIEILNSNDKESCSNMFNQMDEYGLFVVRDGELESWLKYLGISGDKSSWLTKMFEAMGDNPESPNYVLPTDDDVWKFVHHIKMWLTNSQRKGIPI